jgi:hypothetical protein
LVIKTLDLDLDPDLGLKFWVPIRIETNADPKHWWKERASCANFPLEIFLTRVRYTGWLALHITVHAEAADFEGVAQGHLTLTVESPHRSPEDNPQAGLRIRIRNFPPI